jgi:hypothetical protein
MYNRFMCGVKIMDTIKNFIDFQEIIKKEMVVIIAKTKTCVVCKPLSEKLRIFM